MDAPPQRLMRPYHKMDENAPFIATAAGKPLHSRYKSTPVLPSVNIGGQSQKTSGVGQLLLQKSSNLTAIDPAIHESGKALGKQSTTRNGPTGTTGFHQEQSLLTRTEDGKLVINDIKNRPLRPNATRTQLPQGLELNSLPINKAKPKRSTAVFRDTSSATEVAPDPITTQDYQSHLLLQTGTQEAHEAKAQNFPAVEGIQFKPIDVQGPHGGNHPGEKKIAGSYAQAKSVTEQAESYSEVDRYNARLYETELSKRQAEVAASESDGFELNKTELKEETNKYNVRLALEESASYELQEQRDEEADLIPYLDHALATGPTEGVHPDVLIPSLSQLTTQDSYIDPSLRDYVLPDTNDFNRFAPVNEQPAEPEYVVAPEYPSDNNENVPPGGVIPQVSEVEYEYVEEEDYDEPEGYTTAHSFYSHGGYTTGETTVLHDVRVTAKIARELHAAQEYVEKNTSPDEIREEMDDMSMVQEYAEEIFEHMRNIEAKMRVRPNYMDISQSEVVWSMRAVLVDWMIQVHDRFGLLPETLFLAVNYVDRFLSVKNVSLGKLQLVGATALFIAAKFEEINIPGVHEMVFMVDKSYTVDEILKAERFMLMMLKFEMSWPGPMSFLRRISKADDYDLETRTLAKYFLEVTLVDERFVSCVPSLTAAAAHCLARVMLRKGDWGYTHTHYSQYTYEQLRPLMKVLVECCTNAKTHHKAVYDKYVEKKFKRAAQYVENELMKGWRLPYAGEDQHRFQYFSYH